VYGLHVIFPSPLSPGDRIAVVAGSSSFDRTLAYRGLAWLRQRYRVEFRSDMFSIDGFLAGSDQRRCEELTTALADPSLRAIVCMRGGYGLSRITHQIDWNLLTQFPKWVVGFSDSTVLHVEIARLDLASVHAPMVTSLGRSDHWTRENWIRALEHPTASSILNNLDPWCHGSAEGRLFGGNLAILHDRAAAGRLKIPEGAILLLEDVGERPYRIDRMLASLREGGHLQKATGVLLGSWTNCHPGHDNVTAEEVLRHHLASLRVPVLSGAPIGHGRWNLPVVLGRRWRLQGSLAFTPPEVELVAVSIAQRQPR